ncbi:MAG TPA: S8 family serine peptidase, partial [Blastocatellia bacterium]
MIRKIAVLAIVVLALAAAGWNLSWVTEASDSGQTRKSSSKNVRKSQPGRRGDDPAQREIPIAPRPPDPTARQTGRVFVLIELKEEPTTRVYAATLEKSSLPKAEAREAATFAARQQLAVIYRSQAALAARLASPEFDAKELYRVQRVLNAIAVEVDASKVEQIRRLPNVKDVQLLEEEFIGNATSVPFLGTPQLWENTLGLPAGATGTGIKIGIIDTGIDYQHANFGGTGLLADYQANNRTVAPDAFFPTAKVVGGTDFAGDAYNGNNTPVPDNDPMDCNGHGSHVAGTAAGFGVKTDSTTFPGPYNTAVPFSSLRIGPGVAPQASLYALRVFGCGGSTRVTVQAIDWSVDPNGDGDFSDHLDVINMSLGSNYGTLTNTSTLASENAALAGVVVVAASGNAGDTYFITSSPANASSAISVAAINDTRAVGALLTINSPAAIAGKYAAGAAVFTPAPPAPSGQTANIVAAIDPADGAGPLTTDGCSPFTNAAAIAGNIALIDRGTCGFINKVANAQAAGAIGVIIVNNVVGDPIPINMGGTGFTITIPSVLISKADGDAIRAQLALGAVNATLGAATGADTVAGFSSRGPRIDSPNRLKPDIAAPGVSIVSTQTGVTCVPGGGCIRSDATGFLAGSQSLTISGTSMATPHMAGVMALLRQLHPDWGVEELKALAMDTALNDVTIGGGGGGARYGPGRVGAGRVDPAKAATAQVIAYNADEPGQV